jgi:hypothetical protein
MHKLALLTALTIPSLAFAEESSDFVCADGTKSCAYEAFAAKYADLEGGVWIGATNLYAGKDLTKIGAYRGVYDSYAGKIYLQFATTEKVSKIDVAVGCSVGDLPQTKTRNPKVGSFQHVFVGEGYGSVLGGEVFTVDASSLASCTTKGGFALAVHADSNLFAGYYVDKYDSMSGLVGLVGAEYSLKYPGADSYFEAKVAGEGPFDSFCIDSEHSISPGTVYKGDTYSIYDDKLASYVKYADNINAAAWLLNNRDYSAKATWREVQYALWKLLSVETSHSSLGSFDKTLAVELADAALKYSVGWEPEAGDVIPVGLVVDADASGVVDVQLTVFLDEVYSEALYDGETAWGDGDDFGGDSWALVKWVSYTTGS